MWLVVWFFIIFWTFPTLPYPSTKCSVIQKRDSRVYLANPDKFPAIFVIHKQVFVACTKRGLIFNELHFFQARLMCNYPGIHSAVFRLERYNNTLYKWWLFMTRPNINAFSDLVLYSYFNFNENHNKNT